MTNCFNNLQIWKLCTYRQNIEILYDYLHYFMSYTSLKFWLENILSLWSWALPSWFNQSRTQRCGVRKLRPSWFLKGYIYMYKIMGCHYYWIWPAVYLFFGKFCIFWWKLHDIFCNVCTFMLHNLHFAYIPH